MALAYRAHGNSHYRPAFGLSMARERTPKMKKKNVLGFAVI
jgi:hypothetical protein